MAKTVDRVAERIASGKVVSLAFPLELGATNATGKWKQNGNAAARRAIGAGQKRRGAPDQVDVPAPMWHGETVAIESETDQHLGRGSAAWIVEHDIFERGVFHGYRLLNKVVEAETDGARSATVGRES